MTMPYKGFFVPLRESEHAGSSNQPIHESMLVKNGQITLKDSLFQPTDILAAEILLRLEVRELLLNLFHSENKLKQIWPKLEEGWLTN